MAAARRTHEALALAAPLVGDNNCGQDDDDCRAGRVSFALWRPTIAACAARSRFANSSPATTINVPAGNYNLTISGAGEGFAGDNTVGDLDITANNTSIVGAGRVRHRNYANHRGRSRDSKSIRF